MRSVPPVETPSSYGEVGELLSQRLIGEFLERFHNGKENWGGWGKGWMGFVGRRTVVADDNQSQRQPDTVERRFSAALSMQKTGA